MIKGIHDAKEASVNGRPLDLSSVAGLQAAERSLKVIGSRMEGNDYSKLRLRRNLFAMIGFYGTPHLWITISPADLYSPVLMYFCGCKLRLGMDDPDVPNNLPEFRERLSLMAANSVALAVFFDRIVNSFLRCLLGGVDEHKQPEDQRLGVFGVVQSFFGVVETQGRGTEHLHSVVWLRYGKMPGELQEKLLEDSEEARVFRRGLLEYLNDIVCETLQPHMDSRRPKEVCDKRPEPKLKQVSSSTVAKDAISLPEEFMALVKPVAAAAPSSANAQPVAA